MKKFSILHLPVLSFYSGQLYQDVGLNWRGIGFGYLFLLLAVCAIPKMFKLHNNLSLFIDKEAPPFIEQVPKITIEKGEVHIDQPQPYYIKVPDSNQVLAIIDTTGQIQSLENTEAFALLMKTKLIMRQNNVESRTYDLSQIKSFVVDQDKITGWLNAIQKVVLPFLYPFVLLGSFIFRSIQALIYAAIGLLFAALCKIKLSYAALLRLAVVAVTPCIILRTVFEIVSLRIPMAGLLFFLIAMAYLFWGVKTCSITQSADDDRIFPQNQSRPPNY